jgi:hypothetical protein
MKHCPTCKFRFPDFQSVCDFDGTELFSDPQRQALIKLPPQPSRVRRVLPSRSLLTTMAVLVLFLSAVVIGYLKSDDPLIPAVKQQPILASGRLTEIVSSSQHARDSEQSRRNARVKRSQKSSSAASRRQVVVSRSVAPQQIIAENRSQKRVVARQSDGQQSSRDKSPKIAAILKTTWKVLKKPFDF